MWKYAAKLIFIDDPEAMECIQMLSCSLKAGGTLSAARAHSIPALFIVLYGFWITRNIFFLTTSGGNTELKGDCEGWFSRSLRTRWVALYQSSLPFYDPYRSSILHCFMPKNLLAFTHWARSADLLFRKTGPQLMVRVIDSSHKKFEHWRSARPGQIVWERTKC